ncbi:MAG: protein kinase domain-containing protein [Microthrixaceae bacterium]
MSDTANRPTIDGVVLSEVLGRGASSVVYLGTQERFGRQVAVKVLDLPGQDELANRLFVNECRTLGGLGSHPNIVTVFDGGIAEGAEGGGRPYLVMEYLPGGTLARQLAEARDGGLPVEEVLQVGVQVAGALATAHRHGIVHGDVKPQNLLVGRPGEVLLSDFGISRFASAASVTTRVPVFTPLHAAPEMFDGAPASELTDVYELASTLFELLDGRPALGDAEDSPLLVVGRMARNERRSLDRDALPAEVCDLVESGLAREPSERPAGAEAFGEALRSVQVALGFDPTPLVVLDDLPVTAPPVGGPEEAAPAASTIPPTGSRRPWALLVVGVVAVVALVAAGTWALLRGGGADDSADATAANPPPSTVTTLFTQPTDSGADGMTDPGETSTTVNGGSPFAGMQADVRYDVPGVRDTSSVLGSRMADPVALARPLDPGVQVVEAPTFFLDRLPAEGRWQSFNADKDPACMGFMTRPFVVTGLWEKSALWPAGQAWFRVVQFRDPADARMLFNAWSLEQGVTGNECRGFSRPFGAEDIDAVQVEHREPELDLGDRSLYNTWLKPPPAGMTQFQTVRTAALVVGDSVVTMAIGSKGPAISPEQLQAVVAGFRDALS